VTIIEARGVELSFGTTPALRGANLAVAAGEILAVMGPSGSGKSTLLHCLAGILVPQSGEIHFEGRRIDALGENERSALRRDQFGFVFQFGQLVPELTAEENVALPLLLAGTRREPALRSARTWFERVGLEGLERRRSGELSGGEAQRVALARALVREPELLLLDEPFAALDALTRLHMQDLIAELCARHRPAVLLVTHDVEEAILLADRIAVLREGRFVTDLPVALERPRDRTDRDFVELRRRLLTDLGVDTKAGVAP
jgi:putative ABC transport system ATP-binding protein